MGGLATAVHWWEEPQMRVLVLGSLAVQLLLFIFSLRRRYAMHNFFRFIMWIAYLASDALAIYALATLFNRHTKDQDHRRGGNKSMSTLTLELLWAPILLIHLGGHDGITAYNIEDNELWSRHLLTAASQVTVAIYVFSKSWPPSGDKRLLQASILLFVPGVLKCFAKPWALMRASITSLVSSPDAKRTAKKSEAGEMDANCSLEKYVKQAKYFVQEQKNKTQSDSKRACVQNGDHPPPQQAKQNKDEMDPLEEYVKRKIDFVVGEQKHEGGAQGERAHKQTGSQKERRRERILLGEAYKQFVDLSSPYGRRLSIFKYFWVLSQDDKAAAEATTTIITKPEEEEEEEEDKAGTPYGYVRRGLARAFLLLYTKLKSAGTRTETSLDVHTSPATLIGLSILISRLCLPWAAIGLFHQSNIEAAYNDTDAKITYAILCCTAVLETCSFIAVFFTEVDGSFGSSFLAHNNAMVITSREQWPEMVAQHSLMAYFARHKNHGKLMRIASMFGCKGMAKEPCFSSRGITALVLGYLRAGWQKKIQDVASYHSFMDNRGHFALQGSKPDLSWSVKEPFDESVLLWHIATDFCFFSSPFSEHTCAVANISAQGTRSSKCGESNACRAVRCRQMSNYMVYLLFVNPEMLLPGTRRNLFTTAYSELKLILGDDKLSHPLRCCQWVEAKELMEILADTVRDKSKEEDLMKTGSKEGQSKPKGGSKGNFIDDAWDLAQGLLKLRDDFGDEKMWEVIQGVWVEMLCFSASRCRGYLHAKALGSGGEFLSYVWLLLFYMGMETFTERLQREKQEFPSREVNNNAAPAPQVHSGNGNGTTSSTNRIRSRGASSPSHLHTGAGASTSSSEIHVAHMV